MRSSKPLLPLLVLLCACDGAATSDAGALERAPTDANMLAANDAGDDDARDASPTEPHDDDAAHGDGTAGHDAKSGARDASVLHDPDVDPSTDATVRDDASMSIDGGSDLPDAGPDDLLPPTLETLPYARAIVSYTPGEHAGFGQTSYPDIALGPPKGAGDSAGSLDVLSLGVGGSIVLDFGDYDVIDGPGIDLIVFENAFFAGGDPTQPFTEPAEVALSEDGESWHRFECDPQSAARAGCAGITPVQAYDPLEVYPLDPELTGGDGFDLESLGLSRARYVRIADLSETGESNNAGFDLDAVGLVHFELR